MWGNRCRCGESGPGAGVSGDEGGSGRRREGDPRREIGPGAETRDETGAGAAWLGGRRTSGDRRNHLTLIWTPKSRNRFFTEREPRRVEVCGAEIHDPCPLSHPFVCDLHRKGRSKVQVKWAQRNSVKNTGDLSLTPGHKEGRVKSIGDFVLTPTQGRSENRLEFMIRLLTFFVLRR